VFNVNWLKRSSISMSPEMVSWPASHVWISAQGTRMYCFRCCGMRSAWIGFSAFAYFGLHHRLTDGHETRAGGREKVRDRRCVRLRIERTKGAKRSQAGTCTWPNYSRKKAGTSPHAWNTLHGTKVPSVCLKAQWKVSFLRREKNTKVEKLIKFFSWTALRRWFAGNVSFAL